MSILKDSANVSLKNIDYFHVWGPIYESLRIVLNSRGFSLSPQYLSGISGEAFGFYGSNFECKYRDSADELVNFIKKLGFDSHRITPPANSTEVEDAIESMDYDGDAALLTVKSEARLVDAKEFKVDKIELDSELEQYIMAGELEIYVVIEGRGKAIAYGGDDVPETEYSTGDTMLIPSEMVGAITASQPTTMLKVTLPDILN